MIELPDGTWVNPSHVFSVCVGGAGNVIVRAGGGAIEGFYVQQIPEFRDRDELPTHEEVKRVADEIAICIKQEQ